MSCFEKGDHVWIRSFVDGSRKAAVFVRHDPLSAQDGLVAYKIGSFTNVVRWPIKGLRPRG